jgi:hypothetical protein
MLHLIQHHRYQNRIHPLSLSVPNWMFVFFFFIHFFKVICTYQLWSGKTTRQRYEDNIRLQKSCGEYMNKFIGKFDDKYHNVNFIFIRNRTTTKTSI